MEQMKEAQVINGKYAGRAGKATLANKYGLVMFYPVEGIHPYRVCLKVTDIQYKDEKKGGD